MTHDDHIKKFNADAASVNRQAPRGVPFGTIDGKCAHCVVSELLTDFSEEERICTIMSLISDFLEEDPKVFTKRASGLMRFVELAIAQAVETHLKKGGK